MIPLNEVLKTDEMYFWRSLCDGTIYYATVSDLEFKIRYDGENWKAENGVSYVYQIINGVTLMKKRISTPLVLTDEIILTLERFRNHDRHI